MKHSITSLEYRRENLDSKLSQIVEEIYRCNEELAIVEEELSNIAKEMDQYLHQEAVIQNGRIVGDDAKMDRVSENIRNFEIQKAMLLYKIKTLKNTWYKIQRSMFRLDLKMCLQGVWNTIKSKILTILKS